ncbi:interleukin-12 subunit alpha [Lampris incognitus]|uniref:interleukin-12 subunit alpha n=1 Tax=Lampris incognitus TaxID=2546036 RepID=UPI0024B4C2C5|nr:interleukin-12 subunit alpha [Lampris incognitus]
MCADLSCVVELRQIVRQTCQARLCRARLAALVWHSAVCALLVAAQWRVGAGSPVRAPLSLDAQCPSLARSLLHNIRQLLINDSSTFHETICSNETLELKNNTETVLVCTPHLTQDAACMRQRNTLFSESDCVGSIMKDLAHYAGALQSYLNDMFHRSRKDLFQSTLDNIQSLQKPRWSQNWTNQSYDNRQKMCKLMRGFHIRAITINRAMSYISSGDHRQ